MSCRLPITSAANLGSYSAKPAPSVAAGGFIQFPNGDFQPDSAAAGAYDNSAGKWLPVPFAWVSPDGSRYAYSIPQGLPGSDGRVHVVDVRSGSDTTFSAQPGWAVVEYAADGLYLNHVVPNGTSPGGDSLWRVDPKTGAVRQVVEDGKNWLAVASGFAWAMDPTPSGNPFALHPGKNNRIVRLDLQSGDGTTFASRSDAGMVFLGLDSSSRPMIGAFTNNDYRLLSGSKVVAGWKLDDATVPAAAIADGSRTWLLGADNRTIWLYERGRAVADVATAPPGTTWALAGRCA